MRLLSLLAIALLQPFALADELPHATFPVGMGNRVESQPKKLTQADLCEVKQIGLLVEVSKLRQRVIALETEVSRLIEADRTARGKRISDRYELRDGDEVGEDGGIKRGAPAPAPVKKK